MSNENEEKIEIEDPEKEEQEVEIDDPELKLEKGEDPVKDPGEEEGKPKKEGPAPGTKRFEAIYGKMKELERTIEDMREHGMQSDPVFKQMVDHNKKLSKTIDKLSTTIDNAAHVDEEDAYEQHIDDLKDEIKALKAERQEARNEYDHEKADDLSDKIHDLELDLRDVKREAKSAKETEQAMPKELQEEQQEAYAEFLEASPWADPENEEEFDEVMQAAAIALDNRLKTQVKWKDKPLVDRFMHVKESIEKKFGAEGEEPEKNPGKKPEKKKAPSVEGGRSAGSKGQGKKVSLTKEELAIAAGFDMTPEEFARQKALMGGN